MEWRKKRAKKAILGDKINLIIIIGGVPGTGKTKLVLEIRKRLHEFPFYMRDGLIDYEFYPEHKLEIWGKYAVVETFAGTDRLSMAAQRDVPTHLRNNQNTILIEGDRFFNPTFFESVKDKKIIILEASDDIIKKRFAERGSKQSKSFLKSRRTKVENIKKKYDHVVYLNATKNDLGENIARIFSILENES